MVAQRWRRELWERHAGLGSSERTGDLDREALADLFELTDEVLMHEDLAAEHRDQQDHSRSSRRIYTATAALVLAATAMLVVGIVLGWISGWGIAAVSIAGVTGLVMAGAHAVAEPAGHQDRARIAILSLIPGVAVVSLAPGWLPWWASVIALLLLVGSAAAFVATARLDLSDDGKD